MAGVLIRMKLAVLRNSMTGGAAAWMITGGVLGLLSAAATIALTFTGRGVRGDLLACALAIWTLGWVAGPLLGGSAVLRGDHFALVPISRRRLATGLLGAAFAGVTTLVTAVAFTSLIAYGLRLGARAALTAVSAATLLLIFVVLLSRVAHTLLGTVARSRTGAAITGVLLGGLLTATQSGWMVVVGLVSSDVLDDGFPTGFSTVLRAVPSGWGVVAVEAAGQGDSVRAAGALAGLAGLIALLWLAFVASLGRPRRRRLTIRGSAHGGAPARGVFAGPTGAVFRKELRTWFRDPQQWTAVALPVSWALLTVLLPLTFDAWLQLPWVAPAIALFAIPSLGNLYGRDGTALWLTLTTASQRADVRGRQWAYLVVVGPIAVVLGIGFTLWSGHLWTWPWIAATVPALLGGGAGLIAYASVAAMVPGPDAHQRPDNPLERADTTGPAQVLFWLGLLPAVPAFAVVLLGEWLDSTALRWAGAPVGLATGIALAWWLGHAAVTRLTARGPEMLSHLRTGHAPAATEPAPGPAPAPAPGQGERPAGATVASLVGGTLLLFPQGLVPLVFLLAGVDAKVWFLAMYLPVGWGLALAALCTLTGALLLARAVRLLRGKPQRAQPTSPPPK
ncbi:hypothetical protein [Paractinoplanes maris]|uniref:hypothetical protein n=1 Tax=Paractinoplanes maris TaxID=1734446 RepID=UPI002022110B|nr:hypothetical protein [Actinoplanes maris]